MPSCFSSLRNAVRSLAFTWNAQRNVVHRDARSVWVASWFKIKALEFSARYSLLHKCFSSTHRMNKAALPQSLQVVGAPATRPCQLTRCGVGLTAFRTDFSAREVLTTDLHENVYLDRRGAKGHSVHVGYSWPRFQVGRQRECFFYSRVQRCHETIETHNNGWRGMRDGTNTGYKVFRNCWARTTSPNSLT